MIKQAIANPQVLQNYYAQLYGLTSPAQQVTMQPLLQHPPAQLQAAAPFFPAPSLSHNFRLQLPPPPQAMPVLPMPPNTTESLPADQAAASVARATNASSTPGA